MVYQNYQSNFTLPKTGIKQSKSKSTSKKQSKISERKRSTDEIRAKIEQELKILQEDQFRDFDYLQPDNEEDGLQTMKRNIQSSDKKSSFNKLKDFRTLTTNNETNIINTAENSSLMNTYVKGDHEISQIIKLEYSDKKEINGRNKPNTKTFSMDFDATLPHQCYYTNIDKNAKINVYYIDSLSESNSNDQLIANTSTPKFQEEPQGYHEFTNFNQNREASNNQSEKGSFQNQPEIQQIILYETEESGKASRNQILQIIDQNDTILIENQEDKDIFHYESMQKEEEQKLTMVPQSNSNRYKRSNKDIKKNNILVDEDILKLEIQNLLKNAIQKNHHNAISPSPNIDQLTNKLVRKMSSRNEEEIQINE